MNVLEQKKLLVKRILPYLTGAPDDVVQRLLQKSVSDLEMILEDAITKKAQADAAERVAQHADEMRAASVSEDAWTHACRAPINGKRLSIIQSNRDLLESLLNPGETPSAKLYIALAQQYPQRKQIRARGGKPRFFRSPIFMLDESLNGVSRQSQSSAF